MLTKGLLFPFIKLNQSFHKSTWVKSASAPNVNITPEFIKEGNWCWVIYDEQAAQWQLKNIFLRDANFILRYNFKEWKQISLIISQL